MDDLWTILLNIFQALIGAYTNHTIIALIITAFILYFAEDAIVAAINSFFGIIIYIGEDIGERLGNLGRSLIAEARRLSEEFRRNSRRSVITTVLASVIVVTLPPGFKPNRFGIWPMREGPEDEEEALYGRADHCCSEGA